MNTDEKIEALSAVPLFSQVGRKDLERLAMLATERSYASGTNIVSEGEVGVAMFVISDGTVEVVKAEDGKDVKIDELKRGAFFGEMALFENFPRNATVRATSDVTCLALTEWDVHAELRETPAVAIQLLKAMVRRLRTATQELADLKGGGGGGD
ncbi:MAG: cyclic nucleotide-binding domain-containing protein [Dehalococcoidia bacterium]